VQTASTAAVTGAQLATNINANASVTGVSASFAAGVMTLSAVDGRNIVIAQTATAGEGLTATTDANNNSIGDALTFAAGTVTGTATGSIRLTASEAITVSGAGAADAGLSATSYALGNSALNSSSVTTAAAANTTISRVDAALNSVSSLRSNFGAIQNRFESTVTNLQMTSENLSASRSRVQDADFAEETAALTKNQILQQAGVAMLAQANALPQNVLALLRG
jgi:flagellin